MRLSPVAVWRLLLSVATLVSMIACRSEPASIPAPAAPSLPPASEAPGPTTSPPTPSRSRVFDTVPQPPPELGAMYIDRDVCPGECCTYREWTSTGAVDVVAEPGSTRVVARLIADEKIQAETGEVHLRPRPALVRRSRDLTSDASNPGAPQRTVSLTPGDVIWVLAPLGEGWSHVWAKGQVYDADTNFMWTEPCPVHDEEECWASADPDDGEPQRWWVRVRTAAGVVGWVDNTSDVLQGFDACG